MKVLICCEESQRVCKAFRDKGHEAYSCDIIEPSGGYLNWHIKQDVLPLINGNCSFQTMDGQIHIIEGKWDILIAHPPCTYLTAAGAVRMFPHKGQLDTERFEKALEAKEFFLKFINADCDKICVENPAPLKIMGLPPYTQIIENHVPFVSGGSRNHDGTRRKNLGVAHNAKERSKTFEGIAQAMAEQWG